MAEIRKNVKNIFIKAGFAWHVRVISYIRKIETYNFRGPQPGPSPVSSGIIGIIGIDFIGTDYTASQEMPCAKRLFPETSG